MKKLRFSGDIKNPLMSALLELYLNDKALIGKFIEIIPNDDYPLIVEESSTEVEFPLSEIQRIVDERKFANTIENVKSRLAGRFMGGENEWDYDTEKYPPTAVEDIAQRVIHMECDNECISGTYWIIVDHAIDENNNI